MRKTPLVACAIGILLLPLLYQALAATPWSRNFFESGDRDAYFAVLGTILFAHAVAGFSALRAARALHLTPAELGLPNGTRGLVLLSVGVLLSGLALVAIFGAPGAGAETQPQIPIAPQSLAERLCWALAALVAGLSEEFVFRAFAIAVFRRIGFPFVVAVALPSLAWVFIHGQLPPSLIATYFLAGLAFSALFLWRGLALVVGAHGAVNLLLLVR